MPKPISAADFVPTMLAMVMLDRRRALMGDGCESASDNRAETDASGPAPRRAGSRRRRDRRAECGSEASP